MEPRRRAGASKRSMGLDLKGLLDSARRPGYRRSLYLRRAAAGALVAAAGLGVLAERGGEVPVLALAEPVEAGSPIGAAALTEQRVPPALAPQGHLSGPEGIERAAGAVATAPLAAGEILTEHKLLGHDSAARLLGETPPELGPATLVPLAVAAPEILPLLRHGDVVSVISHDGDRPRVVAGGARVVLAGEPGEESSDRVLLALPEVPAEEVAAASLVAPLTLVVTGPRARVA